MSKFLRHFLSVILKAKNSILSLANGKGLLLFEDNSLGEERSDDPNYCLRIVGLTVQQAYTVFCTIGIFLSLTSIKNLLKSNHNLTFDQFLIESFDICENKIFQRWLRCKAIFYLKPIEIQFVS